MNWLVAGPKRLALILLFLTAIPILFAGVRMVELTFGTLPADALKFATTPVGLFLHAFGGAVFGILGPIQFAGVFVRRFGRLHRILGRVFVAAGALLAISSLRLLWAHPISSTPLLDWARLLAGLGLGASLGLAITAIRRRDVATHKAWMIRAYAIGMGSGTVSFIMLPIFLITGEPVVGLLADLVFVGSWALNVWIAEVVVRRGRSRPLPQPALRAA